MEKFIRQLTPSMIYSNTKFRACSFANRRIYWPYGLCIFALLSKYLYSLFNEEKINYMWPNIVETLMVTTLWFKPILFQFQLTGVKKDYAFNKLIVSLTGIVKCIIISIFFFNHNSKSLWFPRDSYPFGHGLVAITLVFCFYIVGSLFFSNISDGIIFRRIKVVKVMRDSCKLVDSNWEFYDFQKLYR